ncbi:MAG: hypothetical protein OHK0046_08670 [Anaerolineae bacterium]
MTLSARDKNSKVFAALRKYLCNTLQPQELSSETVDSIVSSLEIDSGLLLSLNTHYERSELSFTSFVEQFRLSSKLVSAMPRLAESNLYLHQEEGVLSILNNQHTIISTGTGSGKTETFLVPILSYCFQHNKPGLKAIIIYPMNALASDQVSRISEYTKNTNVTFGLYTGDTSDRDPTEYNIKPYLNQITSREAMRHQPPDILITNYVMLERMLTRKTDQRIFQISSDTLQYIVLDELHTYSGSTAAHLKFLLARLGHYWQKKPVYIGTSATLASDSGGRQRLDTFLRQLFEIERGSYKFIEAKRKSNSGKPAPPPLLNIDDLNKINFSDETLAAGSLTILTNQPIDPMDFYGSFSTFQETKIFEAVQNNLYVHTIQKALEQGAQSLNDLARCIKEVMPAEQVNAVSPEQIVTAYLDAINFVDRKVGKGGRLLLDFRVHVFIQSLTGKLKRCVECRRYFAGETQYCPDDGYILFPVYRHDTSYGVAKVNEHCLSSTLLPESTDSDGCYYVLIKHIADTEIKGDGLRAELEANGAFRVVSTGRYHIVLLKALSYEQLEHDLITLADERRDYISSVYLVKTLLQTYGKSLAFVDNREKASRYGTIIRDKFADDFLFEFLKLNYSRSLNLTRTLLYLQRKAEAQAQSESEKMIFAEMSLWYHRMIAMPDRISGRVNLIKLREDSFEWETLTELQHALLDIFIRERAIRLEFHGNVSDSHFIRFDKHWITNPYGIYMKDTILEDPNYRGLSLSDRSRNYSDFIERWTEEAVCQSADELVSHGILMTHLTSDDKSVYYIKPEYLCFDLQPSSYDEGEEGYEALKKEHLFVSETHSSDLQNLERDRVATDIKSGNVQFVVATPTLEMGIDIGDLENVLMIGVPPNPASYAQRAGRAGRGQNRGAVIITLCSPSSLHDMYAFRNPRSIINGHVSPPAFNPRNPEILKKHIHAFALRDHLEDEAMLRRFLSNVKTHYQALIPELKKLFGTWFDFDGYEQDLKSVITSTLSNGKNGLTNYCYDNGIFPDYGFQRDEVIAIDIEKQDEVKKSNPLGWQSYALTVRSVEQAFRFFVPGQIAYMAGDVYRILAEGIYEELDDGARSYSCVFVEKDILFARHSKELKVPALRQHFTPIPRIVTNLGDIVEVGYLEKCLLSFRNEGTKYGKDVAKEKIIAPVIGYDLQREALVLRFDSQICDLSLRNSLVAVLVYAINRHYSLRQGELRLMLNAHLPEEKQERWLYTILYDNDGNNNLPLESIYKNFSSIIRLAYEQLASCSCDQDGCYNCILSYNTQSFAETLSKAKATMFTGYLLGKNRFQPMVLPFIPTSYSPDLRLTVAQRNGQIHIKSTSGKEYSETIAEKDFNDTLFTALAQAVTHEYQPSMKVLQIDTWTDWLANSLNRRSVNKGKQAFNLLQVALLPFDHVKARTISQKRISIS